jgi:hypothetical protein
MRSVNTDSFLVVEVIGGLDAYCEDLLVCCIHGKSLDDFSYDGKIDTDKLEEAIDDEMETLNIMENVINDPYLNL